MNYVVHDAPGYKLEAVVSHHPISGSTVEIFSTWPEANHPDPHRLLSLTLPPESLLSLAKAFELAAGGDKNVEDKRMP